MTPEFSWGDTVKVVEPAPLEFRLGMLGAVCGLWVKSDPGARGGEQRMYTVEFGDGQTLEIPGYFLTKVEDDSE
jgi:hypothetical protein